MLFDCGELSASPGRGVVDEDLTSAAHVPQLQHQFLEYARLFTHDHKRVRPFPSPALPSPPHKPTDGGKKNRMGYTSLTSQALSAPPYLLSFAAVLLTASLSDRLRTRGPFVIFHALLACASYLALSLSSPLGLPDWLRYILV